MNSDIFRLALAPLFLTAFFAYLVTPFVIKFANFIGIIDDPKKNKHEKVIHTYPVPRGGGLATSFAIIAACIIFLPFDKHLSGIIVGVFLLTVLGLMDDKYNLDPKLRLIMQLLTASIPIIAGIGIAFITLPFFGQLDLAHPQINFYMFGGWHSIWIISDFLAIIWIVYLMNMVNMGAKGIDGQLSGVVAIAAVTIAALSLRYSADITQWPVIILASITAGAYLGFLPWNFYPQKIMPGFSGSTVAGFLLAVLSILSTTKIGTLFVVLGIPLVDTGYTMIRRIASGKSPIWGDRGHLHHKLLDYGFSKKKVVYFYWVATVVLGVIALNLNSSYKFYTIVGVVLIVGGLLLWLRHQINQSSASSKSSSS